MRLKPFTLLGDSVLEGVRTAAMSALHKWQADWGLGQLTVETSVTRAWEAQSWHRAMQWQHVDAGNKKAIWFGWLPELGRYLQRQMFPLDMRQAMHTHEQSAIAQEGADKAIVSLLQAVAQRMSKSAQLLNTTSCQRPGDGDVFAYASGAVVLNFRLGEQSLWCVLNHAAVGDLDVSKPAHVAATLPPVDLFAAIRQVPVALPVEIGTAEVDVGNLLMLAPGDVIRLDSCVDKPLPIVNADSTTLFGAYLGRVGSSTAIEVVRNSP